MSAGFFLADIIDRQMDHAIDEADRSVVSPAKQKSPTSLRPGFFFMGA
jgi:hypothetical protein